jgi:hypothetical protein
LDSVSCDGSTPQNRTAIETVNHLSNYPEIKQFVQKTLGCSCPEEVFEKVEYEKGGGEFWEKRINVGNRLLIYIITSVSESDIAQKIKAALASGVAERNKHGLNRFRLVVATSGSGKIQELAEMAFNESGQHDEKTHLHFVKDKDISPFENA